jgi:hypothetical protein
VAVSTLLFPLAFPNSFHFYAYRLQKLSAIIFSVVHLLAVPFIAMPFAQAVNRVAFNFTIAESLLPQAGLT